MYTSQMAFLIGGPNLEGAKGVDEIASFTLKPAHREAIHLGLAHFASLPLIDLRGHHAIVTCYLQILHLDHEGVSRDLPNHGTSQGYRIHRVYVNRWELEKINGQWMIRRRTLTSARWMDRLNRAKLLSQGLSDVLKEDGKTRASKGGSRKDSCDGQQSRLRL